MKRNIIALVGGWMMAATVSAQTFGEMIYNTNKYELDDMVVVTSYHKGIPTGKFHVTGDDKIRIMKAVGFIQEVCKPEYVRKEDAITIVPLYSYARNLAPLDSADTYEIAPFLRDRKNPFGPALDWKGEYMSDIGGIVISADKNDSTVVFGTVCSAGDPTKRDHFYRMDSIFSYPYQYLGTVAEKPSAERVQALRTLVQQIERYRTGFYYYGDEWTLDKKGGAVIQWYTDGKCVMKGVIDSDKLLARLYKYFPTLAKDYTGRGFYRCSRFKDGYKSGLTFTTAYEGLVNVYEDISKGDFVKIMFPGRETRLDVSGLLIQTGEENGRVYGLYGEDTAGYPYLFYNDDANTRKMVKWMKKHLTEVIKIKIK